MKKFLIVILIGLVAFGYFSAIYSDERTPAQKWSDAEKALKQANDRMDTLNKDLAKYKAEYTEKAGNALTAAVTMWNPIDAIKTLFLGRGTPNRIFELKTLMISIYIQQEALNGDFANLASARDTAHDAYVQTTSQPADKINQPKYADIPNVSLPCMNRCGTVYNSSSVGLGNLADKAIQGHGVYCNSDPHKGYWYYSCPAHGSPGCPASEDHYVACVGGCGQKGKPEYGKISKRGRSYGPKKGFGNTDIVTIFSHLKRCTAMVSRGFPNVQCSGWYYQCNGQTSADCPNSDNHVSSSSSTPPSGSTPPPPTDNTPNCQDCTTHCSSPCNCTNSGTCGGTVSTPPSGGSSPPPEPEPEPTTVACGGAAWTGCSGASSRTEHHVPSCSHCNNGYWTCSQWAYQHTTQNTCRRPGCGVTYYECQNGTCSSDWGTNPYHWAQ